MRESSIPWMPDLRLGADPCVMSRWSKSAKTLRDSNGRLLVWKP
jgi:hypothetical protein